MTRSYLPCSMYERYSEYTALIVRCDIVSPPCFDMNGALLPSCGELGHKLTPAVVGRGGVGVVREPCDHQTREQFSAMLGAEVVV